MQYGYFDNEKREYVIDKRGTALFLDQLSGCRGHGGGHQSYGGRLSVLQNTGSITGSAVSWEWGTHDRPGFYVYIRDNEKKDYHSISWHFGSEGFIQGKIPLPPRTVLHGL